MVSPEDRARIARENRHRTWVEENPLRLWRRKKSLSQAGLARRLAYTVTSIGYWERHECLPSSQAYEVISLALGVPTTQLVSDWMTWVANRPSEEEETVERG